MSRWWNTQRVQGRTARRRGQPRVEGLESRCLLSVTINEFPLPAGYNNPTGITTGSDGNLWFTERSSDKIGQLNPTTHAVVEFTTPTAASQPTDITSGPDGNLWFTETGGGTKNQIGMINPTTHAIAEFPTHTANVNPVSITAGPDGNLWFTETGQGSSRIGMINPTTHAMAEFPTPTANSNPEGITAGPDGNLWFTENANNIGVINPTTHVITEFALPNAYSSPARITAGPDGNLWFTESLGNKIGMINPTTHAIAEFPTPSADSFPYGITAGPDGNIWFTEIHVDQIARFNPTTHAFDEFAVPMVIQTLNIGITSGPDNNIWFTIPAADTIGQAVIPTAPVQIATTTHLSAAPNPSTVGQQATFTAVVSPQTGTAGPTGSVTFSIDGVAQTPVTLAVIGGREQAIFSTSSLTAGAHTVLAVYNPQGVFSGSSATVRQVVNLGPVVSDGPRILTVQRFGYHARPTRLVLTFDQQLNPATAQNVGAYRIIDPHGRTVSVLKAAYDPVAGMVILTPARRLNLHLRYQLIVRGTGPNAVASASGILLDGAMSGRPGSDFATFVTMANWVRPR